MTSGRRRAVAAIGAVVAVVLAVVAVWLWRSGIATSSYPALQIDQKTVAGPYELTRYSGDRIAGAVAVALVAILVLASSIRALVSAWRR